MIFSLSPKNQVSKCPNLVCEVSLLDLELFLCGDHEEDIFYRVQVWKKYAIMPNRKRM